MADPTLPNIDHVIAAQRRIEDYVHRTPIATSLTLNRQLGLEVFFKCENLQKVGAFKARGALNAVFSLEEEIAQRGVVTHSSGNHGQAIAFAAAERGIPATVVMPFRVPQVKQDAVSGYGALVVRCEQDQRTQEAARVVGETGGTLIHPFDDPAVIAGQGTAAMELLEDVGSLDVVVTPIGGGGLLSGTALVVRDQRPSARLIGAEPEAVDDAYRSFATGVRQPDVPAPDTVADGLLTGIGELPFTILRQGDVRVVLVSESEIINAAIFHLIRMKLVVEPSGATGLAALRKIATEFEGARIGVIISGGNTDFAWLDRSSLGSAGT